MIFGAFTGLTVKDVQKKLDRLTALKADVAASVDKATADRVAAINELKDDLTELSKIKAAL